MATRSADSAVWTPAQALRELADAIDAGKERPENMMLFWLEDDGKGGKKPRRWFANVSHYDAIALTSLAHQMCLDDWRNP